MNPEIILYGMIVVAVVVLVGGTYLVAFGSSINLNTRVNRRLETLDKTQTHDQVLDKLRKEMEQQVSAQSIPLYSTLAEKLRKSGLTLSIQQLFMLMVGASIAAFVALTFLTEMAMAMRLSIAVAAGFGGVYFWISKKAKARMEQLEEQLPDAIELMVRSLRTGSPFSTALNLAAEEVPEPLSTELGVIADEAAYGRDVGDSLRDMAERLNLQDLRFLAVAVSIALQSGGNLAEILAGLAHTIRARFKLFRKITAITAEARFSGNFLSGFPLIALVGINLLEPDYYTEVQETAYFLPAAIIVGIMLVINILVMRILTTIKV